jgi:hypothetical protein
MKSAEWRGREKRDPDRRADETGSGTEGMLDGIERRRKLILSV